MNDKSRMCLGYTCNRKARKLLWKKIVLSTMMTAGVCGVIGAGQVLADAPANTDRNLPVVAAGQVQRSYGPMITVTGSEAEQDNKIHSKWNATYKGDVIGTVVAWGKGNVIHVQNPGGHLGKDDGKSDEKMTISINANLLDGPFYDKNYKKKDAATGKWVEPNYYSGDFVVNDPIVAKTEMGGEIIFEGDTMNYNLLYAHKNQYAEAKSNDNITSKIVVNLTGDLIAGDANNEVGVSKNDWLQQSGLAGGRYKVGDIEAGGSWKRTGAGAGDISITANNVVANNVATYEDSELTIHAKGNIKANNIENAHESNMTLIGKNIEMNELATDMGNAHTIIGDDTTQSVVIHKDINYRNGGSGLPLSDMQIKANTVKVLGGLNIDSTLDSIQYLDAGDTLAIHANDIELKTPLLSGSNVEHLKTKLKALRVSMEAKDIANVSMGPVEFSQNSALSIEAPTVHVSMEDITAKRVGREPKNAPKDAEGSLRIRGNAGSVTTGNIRWSTYKGDLSIEGVNSVQTGGILLLSNNAAWSAFDYPSVANIHADTVSIGKTGTSRNDDYRYNSLTIYPNSSISVHANKEVTTTGTITNMGTIDINAENGHLYQMTTGFGPGQGVDKSTFDYTGKNLLVDTYIAALGGDTKTDENVMNINVSSLTMNPEGAVAKDDTDSKPMAKNVGYVFANHNGTVHVNIADQGTFTGKTALVNQQLGKRDKIGNVNVALGKNADWLVTGDSTLTSLHNDGTVHLVNAQGVQNVTTDNLEGDGHVLVGVVGDKAGLLTAKTAKGTLTVDVQPMHSDDPTKDVYNKVKVVTVTNPDKAFAVKKGNFFGTGLVYGYTAPVSVEGNDTYLDGAFVQNKNVMNPQAAQDASVAVGFAQLWNQGLDVPVIPVKHAKNVWATMSHSALSGIVDGKQETISVGVDAIKNKRGHLGVAIAHTNGHDGESSYRSFHQTTGVIYGAYLPTLTTYVTGKLYAGHVYGDVLGLSQGSMSTTGYGVDVEVGGHHAWKEGKVWLTPYAGLGYRALQGYDVAMNDGFLVNVDAVKGMTGRLGMRVDRFYGKRGQAYAFAQYMQQWKHSYGYSVGAKDGQARGTVEGSAHQWQFGIGGSYRLKNNSRIGWQLGKTVGGDITSPWNVQANVQIKFK